VQASEYAKAPPDEYVPIERLLPYARNARTHSEEQVKQLAAAYVEFGVTSSALFDADSLAHGHGRVMAAELLYKAGKQLFHAPGEKQGGAPIPVGTFPAKRCDGWTAAQKQAYVINDNQVALNAGWNPELLKVELGDLKTAGFDLSLLAFDDKTLGTLLDTPKPVSESAGEGDDEPVEDDPARIIKCPNCNHDFSVLEQMTTQAKRRKKGAGGAS
jgi:hypothetical protein